jgi:mono/diheme cytochrome c family protein
MRKIAVVIICIVWMNVFNACLYNKGNDVHFNCDTASTVSYSQKVLPIFQNNCYSCHTSISTGGGWLMGNYNNDKMVAQSGRLVGAIMHQSGFSAMPKSAPKLTDCQIGTIKKWINEGCLNN